MQPLLITVNTSEKTLSQVSLSLKDHFIKFYHCQDNILKINTKYWKAAIKSDFFIFFEYNSNEDNEILDKLENFLIEHELNPINIIFHCSKKYIFQDLLTEKGKMYYTYEFIPKPLQENLFHAIFFKILKKYLFIKQLKSHLQHLSISIDYHLLEDLSKKKILIIGENKKDIKILQNKLNNQYYVKINHFNNIHENFLEDFPFKFDLILLQDVDNIHHLISIHAKIKAHEDLNEASIIFLIKNTDAIFISDLINLGIDHYLNLPIKELNHLNKIIQLELQQTSYLNFLNGELKNAVNETIFDEATNALSKKYLINFLEKNSENNKLKKILGLIIFDVDSFKHINDQYGHVAGDFLLKEMISILQKELHNKCIIRFGGDEFVVLIQKPQLIKTKILQEITDYIIHTIQEKKFIFKNQLIKIQISAGFVIGKIGQNFNEIIEIADEKLYKHKNQKQNK